MFHQSQQSPRSYLKLLHKPVTKNSTHTHPAVPLQTNQTRTLHLISYRLHNDIIILHKHIKTTIRTRRISLLQPKDNVSFWVCEVLKLSGQLSLSGISSLGRMKHHNLKYSLQRKVFINPYVCGYV